MKFEKKYFVQSDTSNYEDYRKKKFDKLAEELISLVPLNVEDVLPDFGCATGGLLSEIKKKSFDKLKGTDISNWSIEYGRNTYGLYNELDYHNMNLLTKPFDVVLFLDVLEHIPTSQELVMIFKLLLTDKIVVRLPVSVKEGEPYFLEVSRNDTTHVQCHTKEWWEQIFYVNGFFPVKTLRGKTIYDSEGVLARIYEKTG